MPIGVIPGEVSLEKTIYASGPFGNALVNTVDSAVRYQVQLFNLGGDVLVDAETTPGTYVVHRLRAGTDTEITAATAASESSGIISATIDFSDGNWEAGDLGYIEFSGIVATVVDVTSELPALRRGFRIPAEASVTSITNLQSDVTALQTDLTALQASVTTLDGLQDVPTENSTDNAQMRDPIGSKLDDAVSVADDVASAISYLKGLLTKRAGRMVFPGAGAATVVLTSTAANVSLPSVTIAASELPAGMVILSVKIAIAWRKQVDSSAGANAIVGAQQIQVRSDAPGTFRNALTIADNMLATDASATEGGMMLMGETDISVEVVGADTYEFQWTLADVDGDSLTLHDFQTYLIIEHT